MNKNHLFLFLILVFGILACKDHYTPKPRGYIRLDFPEKEFITYSEKCPYSFEYPTYSKVEPDMHPEAEPCWINIEFDDFKGTIHISYKIIDMNLSELIEDSRSFVYKHTIKADAIDETFLNYFEKQVYGMLYEIKGNAASSIQFFLTDSTKHFVRGALYFDIKPNYDSLRPVIHFIKDDIIHFIETFEWKKQ